MKTQSAKMTVLDFCNAIDRGEVRPNENYQRSDKVWSPAARSYLIETILLDFPMPKFSIHQVLDLASGTVRKELVDGQQRSRAIHDFLKGKLRLSKTLESANGGRKFADLETTDREQFLNYPLDIDLYVGSTDREVREVFRRMNVNTVLLNEEEKRHAEFQGPFKWMINAIANDFDEALQRLGVFTSRQSIRMADTKLFTEVACLLEYGVITTKAAELKRIYKTFDRNDADVEHHNADIRWGIDAFLDLAPDVPRTMRRPHQVLTIVGALLINRGRVLNGYEGDLDPERVQACGFERGERSSNLALLAEALERLGARGTPDPADPYFEFWQASSKGTNVGASRSKRIAYFRAALS